MSSKDDDSEDEKENNLPVGETGAPNRRGARRGERPNRKARDKDRSSDKRTGSAAGGAAGGGGGGTGATPQRHTNGAPNPLRPFLKNLGLVSEAAEKGQFALGMGDDIEEEDIAYHAPGLEDVDVGGGEHAAGRNTDGSGEAHPSVQLQDVRMTLKVDWDDGTAPMASGERRPQDIDLTEYGPLLGEGVFSSEEAEERKRKEATRLKQQRHFMENAAGRFKSWNRLDAMTQRRKQLRDSDPLEGGTGDGDAQTDVYERYWRAIKTLQPMERATWLLAQGLLAGFTSAPAVVQLCSPGDLEFITEYRRIANNMRRILFILATVSVMGAIDSLKQALKPAAVEYFETMRTSGGGGGGAGGGMIGEKSSGRFGMGARAWRDRTAEEQLLLVVNVLLYLAVFIATLICSVGDVVIHYKNDYDSLPIDVVRLSSGAEETYLEWQTYALSNEYQRKNFLPILRLFYSTNLIRFALALVAWASVCFLHYLETVGSDTAEVLGELDEQLLSEKEKNRRLTGHTKTLQALNVNELNVLLQEQKRALDMTQHLLFAQQQNQSFYGANFPAPSAVPAPAPANANPRTPSDSTSTSTQRGFAATQGFASSSSSAFRDSSSMV